MRIVKNLIAVFLALTLVLTLVPATAFAAEKIEGADIEIPASKAAAPVIEPREITGITLPVIGEPLSDDFDEFPPDIDYFIRSIQWRTETGATAYNANAMGNTVYHLIINISAHEDGGLNPYIEDLSVRESFLKSFTVEGGVVVTDIGPDKSGVDTYGNFIHLRVDFPKTIPFVPVTEITGVPDAAAAAIPLSLEGTVIPSDATFKDIVWSIDPGATTAAGAVIADGNILKTTGTGKVTVIATVERGVELNPDGTGTDFVQPFEITVTDPGAPGIAGPANMTLAQGYAAAATEPFTITGSPAPDVIVSGDSHITWNGTDKKLEIAEGLIPGDYPVKLTVSNAVGSAVFAFTLTVTAPAIVNAGAPVITRQPQSAEVAAGTAHTLTVEAASPDGGTLSYQWYKNGSASNSGGTAIDGATDSSYTPPTDGTGIFNYYAVVTNTNDGVNGEKTASAASYSAALTVSPPDPGTVSGEIGYEHNETQIIPDENIEPTLNVTVYLRQNDQSVKELETMALEFNDNVTQYYSFAGVGDGWYTVVADSYIGEELFYTITRDVYVNGGRMVESPEPIIFTPGQTQTILDIAEGVEARNVATNDLPDLFETVSGKYNPQYTDADREHLKTGGEVEFKLNVKNAVSADQSLLSGRITADGYSSVLFVDLSLTKTLFHANGAAAGTPSTITDVTPALLEIVVPMTSRQTVTAVYRIHGNEAPEALPSGAANANEYGEYFRYDAEKNTVCLYVSRFSAYAFAVGTGSGGGNSDVPATGLSLNKDELSLDVGESETLTAAVSPSDAADKGVTWTSSDPSIATADQSGKVTAIKPGTAVITARSNSGGYTDSCVVTVTNAAAVPLTGDRSDTELWYILLTASVFGIAAIAARRKKQIKKN